MRFLVMKKVLVPSNVWFTSPKNMPGAPPPGVGDGAIDFLWANPLLACLLIFVPLAVFVVWFVLPRVRGCLDRSRRREAVERRYRNMLSQREQLQYHVRVIHFPLRIDMVSVCHSAFPVLFLPLRGCLGGCSLRVRRRGLGVQAHWAKDRGDKAEQQSLQLEIDKLDDQLAGLQEQYDAIGAVKKHI